MHFMSPRAISRHNEPLESPEQPCRRALGRRLTHQLHVWLSDEDSARLRSLCRNLGETESVVVRRLGRFELAEGGTLFVDEVGELSAEIQVALLRVLQEREFERVGGSRPIRVDVRIVAATNRNLQAAVDEGAFRADLYCRLNVCPLDVPPLRERPEDIPLMVEYFVHRYARQAGQPIKDISNTALDRLQAYRWPGNIRELQNIVERAVIVSTTDTLPIDERWLSTASAGAVPAAPPRPVGSGSERDVNSRRDIPARCG